MYIYEAQVLFPIFATADTEHRLLKCGMFWGDLGLAFLWKVPGCCVLLLFWSWGWNGGVAVAKYGSVGTTVFMPGGLIEYLDFFQPVIQQLFIEDSCASHHFTWSLYIGVQDKSVGSLGNSDLGWQKENNRDQRREHFDERNNETKNLEAGMSLYDEKENGYKTTESSECGGEWQVIKIGKGWTASDCEHIKRNLYFLNVMVSHWRVLSNRVTWSAFYFSSRLRTAYSGVK